MPHCRAAKGPDSGWGVSTGDHQLNRCSKPPSKNYPPLSNHQPSGNCVGEKKKKNVSFTKITARTSSPSVAPSAGNLDTSQARPRRQRRFLTSACKANFCIQHNTSTSSLPRLLERCSWHPSKVLPPRCRFSGRLARPSVVLPTPGQDQGVQVQQSFQISVTLLVVAGMRAILPSNPC